MRKDEQQNERGMTFDAKQKSRRCERAAYRYVNVLFNKLELIGPTHKQVWALRQKLPAHNIRILPGRVYAA